MMNVRQLIQELLKLKDMDKEVLIDCDGSFMSIESVDNCDEEHPGYLIFMEEIVTDETRANGPKKERPDIYDFWKSGQKVEAEDCGEFNNRNME